jgi:hypothetical protein
MNEGTRSGKSTIRLLGISAERPTNGLYLYFVVSKCDLYVYEYRIYLICTKCGLW